MMTGQTVKQRQNHYYGGEEETALYCRLSRDDDQVGDSDSIVHQKEMLLHYAKEQGLKNPQYYVDDGFSGSNFDRPDFKRMMEGVESGKITTVVVKDMSRFGRDHIMVGYYTQYVLPENEVRFIAMRFRNDNIVVIGAGEQKTPISFRKACDIFIPIDELMKADDSTDQKSNETSQKTNSTLVFGTSDSGIEKDEEGKAIRRSVFNILFEF